MLRIEEDNSILLTRGDSANLYILIKDLNGNPYQFLQDDVVTFTVKKPGSSTASITKTMTTDKYIILEPEDTSSLQLGVYMYDLQLVSNDEVYTIITPSIFLITCEVSE